MRSPIQIHLKPLDKTLLTIGWLGLILLWAIPFYYYAELPDMVPRHFGADGQPTANSKKMIVWLNPFITTLIFFGMLLLNRFPHIYNYPTAITAENAERQYTLATRMILSLNICIVWIMLFLSASSLQVAFGHKEGLGKFSVPLIVSVIFIPIIAYLFLSYKNTLSK